MRLGGRMLGTSISKKHRSPYKVGVAKKGCSKHSPSKIILRKL